MTTGHPSALALQTLFRDERLWAVEKPSGMLVHRGWGDDDVVVVDLIRAALGKAPHPVHRLDRGTSGVLLFALDERAARAMGERFERGEVDKRYLALVRGRAPDEGWIDHPLPRKEGGPRVASASWFRRLASAAAEPRELSLVEVRPRTGRPHQVRRHMKHIGHPLIGDANYGKGPLNRAIRDRYGLARLALHAVELAFDHPFTEQRVEVRAPLPDDLSRPLARMGLEVSALEVSAL